MRVSILMSVGLAAFLLAGCVETTTDPSRGGLFSYSPTAYQARQQEKQTALQSEQEQYQRHYDESQALEKSKAGKSAEVARQQKAINSINADIKKLRGQIDSMNAATAEDARKLEELKIRHSALSGKARNFGPADTDARRQELSRLQQELKRLEREANALSRM